MVNQMDGIKIPTKVEEALNDQKWKEVMHVEMEALQENGTWNIVSLRLVTQGYTQTYNVNYQETFAPVMKMNTIRVLLSLATTFYWPLKQFVVNNTFFA